MSVINDIESSAYIQALKQEFADAQAAGASQEQLLAIHAKAQDYRQSYGYTANLDGSQFTVIETYTPVVQPSGYESVQTVSGQTETTHTVSAEETATATNNTDLTIDTSNWGQYAKFALVGIVGLAILDALGGKK